MLYACLLPAIRDGSQALAVVWTRSCSFTPRGQLVFVHIPGRQERAFIGSHPLGCRHMHSISWSESHQAYSSAESF